MTNIYKIDSFFSVWLEISCLWGLTFGSSLKWLLEELQLWVSPITGCVFMLLIPNFNARRWACAHCRLTFVFSAFLWRKRAENLWTLATAKSDHPNNCCSSIFLTELSQTSLSAASSHARIMLTEGRFDAVKPCQMTGWLLVLIKCFVREYSVDSKCDSKNWIVCLFNQEFIVQENKEELWRVAVSESQSKKL